MLLHHPFTAHSRTLSSSSGSDYASPFPKVTPRAQRSVLLDDLHGFDTVASGGSGESAMQSPETQETRDCQWAKSAGRGIPRLSVCTMEGLGQTRAKNEGSGYEGGQDHLQGEQRGMILPIYRDGIAMLKPSCEVLDRAGTVDLHGLDDEMVCFITGATFGGLCSRWLMDWFHR
ncbi:hypothetical protein BC827DRAFT_1385017 [Russula dissimulans]|nr:hypothetical protein BC827DRAFT_1385017 [Russula dissimulans]